MILGNVLASVCFCKLSGNKCAAILRILSALVIISAILLPVQVSAVSTPSGISGHIFDLDGFTQVPYGTHFSINDTSNNYFIEGNTGRGSSSGKFFVAFAAEPGDTVILKAWNRDNEAEKEIILDGFADDVSLLLNMTLMNNPPVVTSLPGLLALEDSVYHYDVEAIDPDSDALLYSLNQSPLGMAIDPVTGLITWIPDDDALGNNSVVVQVSDGENTAYQSFVVQVVGVNDAPIIISEPITSAFILLRYAYDVNANDPEGNQITYSLVQSPARMTINSATGLILWRPLVRDRGNHTIIVKASDSLNYSLQTYVLKVLGARDILSSSIITETAVFEPLQTSVREIKFSGNSSIITGESEVLQVISLVNMPKTIPNMQKRIYKYLHIDSSLNDDEIISATIDFEVAKSWLSNNNISADNIALNRYQVGKWMELETNILEESAGSFVYSAKTSGFSYFAISVKDELPVNQINKLSGYSSNSISNAFALSGSFFGKGGELIKSAKYILKNNATGEIINGRTENTGIFFETVHGKQGDLLELSIPSYDAIFRFSLNNNMENGRFVIANNKSINWFAISLAFFAISSVVLIFMVKVKMQSKSGAKSKAKNKMRSNFSKRQHGRKKLKF